MWKWGHDKGTKSACVHAWLIIAVFRGEPQYSLPLSRLYRKWAKWRLRETNAERKSCHTIDNIHTMRHLATRVYTSYDCRHMYRWLAYRLKCKNVKGRELKITTFAYTATRREPQTKALTSFMSFHTNNDGVASYMSRMKQT